MRRPANSSDTARSARRSQRGLRGVALLLGLLVAAACGGEAAEPPSPPAGVVHEVDASSAPLAQAEDLVAPPAPLVEAFAAHAPRAVVDERAVAQSLGFRAESLACDWGEVPHGEVVQRRFVLRNDTQNRVRLGQPRRLANGVSVEFDREIEPFSEGRVDVRVDTAALRVGDAMVKVPLVGNVVDAPTLVLRGSVLPRAGSAEQRE